MAKSSEKKLNVYIFEKHLRGGEVNAYVIVAADKEEAEGIIKDEQKRIGSGDYFEKCIVGGEVTCTELTFPLKKKEIANHFCSTW
jgi:hypothetical protein